MAGPVPLRGSRHDQVTAQPTLAPLPPHAQMAATNVRTHLDAVALRNRNRDCFCTHRRQTIFACRLHLTRRPVAHPRLMGHCRRTETPAPPLLRLRQLHLLRLAGCFASISLSHQRRACAPHPALLCWNLARCLSRLRCCVRHSRICIPGLNPSGIPPQSPGLSRRRDYPGKTVNKHLQPQRGCGPSHCEHRGHNLVEVVSHSCI